VFVKIRQWLLTKRTTTLGLLTLALCFIVTAISFCLAKPPLLPIPPAPITRAPT
jgi:hypothetical protein